MEDVFVDARHAAAFPGDAAAVEALVRSLERLHGTLRGMAGDGVARFRMQHDVLLRNVRRMVGALSDRRVQSLRSRVFENLLRFNPRDTKTRATEVFAQFVRGITSFSNDEPATPAYHRRRSCGPRDMPKDAYDDTRTCKLTHGNAQLAANKKRIYTCHLERLMYDAIFGEHALFFPEDLAQESSQDRGHRQKLANTARDFETCFPNLGLEVDVTFGNGGVPIVLRVVKKTRRHGRTLSTETYVRTTNDARDVTTYDELYNEDVYCKLEAHDGVRYKTQVYRAPPVRWSKRGADAVQRAIDAFGVLTGP